MQQHVQKPKHPLTPILKPVYKLSFAFYPQAMKLWISERFYGFIPVIHISLGIIFFIYITETYFYFCT